MLLYHKDEKFLLVSQLKDSFRSITANIAEGHGRAYYQDNLTLFTLPKTPQRIHERHQKI